MTIASSLAAACSSKPKPRQKRLRSDRPHARLIRPPKGACTTSCIPPDSSKKRSSTTRVGVGIAPSVRAPSSRYETSCSAIGAESPTSSMSQRGSRPSSRITAIAAESSGVRAGPSPSQKGTEGGAPWASATRTTPCSTLSTRQEAFPSWNTSPMFDSTAKSSSSEPTVMPSGSTCTRYCPVSGIAPPEVSAVMRARRVARKRRFTPSRWRSACRPSACSETTASKSSRASCR